MRSEREILRMALFYFAVPPSLIRLRPPSSKTAIKLARTVEARRRIYKEAPTPEVSHSPHQPLGAGRVAGAGK